MALAVEHLARDVEAALLCAKRCRGLGALLWEAGPGRGFKMLRTYLQELKVRGFLRNAVAWWQCVHNR